ncbi:MAG: HtaA domain-containing protein [Leucobacter sp.]
MTSLDWGILPRFTSYVRGMGDGRVLCENDASELEDGSFSFPSERVLERAIDTVFSFSGTVRFVGHAGMLNLPVSAPEVTVAGDRCTLTIPDPDDGSRLVFATGGLSRGENTRVLCAELILEEDGSELFFYRYPAGFPLAPLRINLDRQDTPL